MAFLLLPLIFGRNSQVPNKTNILTSMVSSLTDITASSMQQCLQQVQVSQTVTLECNVPPDVALGFANSGACVNCQNLQQTNANLDCNPFCRACIQTGFNQTATYVLNQVCKFDNNQSALIKNIVDDSIDQQITNTQSALSKVLDLLPSVNKAPNEENRTELVNEFKNLITQQNIQTLMNNISSSQVIVVKGTGGSTQGGVTQSLLFYNTSSLIANNLQQAGVENNIKLTGVQGITTTSGTSNSSGIIGIIAVILVAFLVFMIWRKFGKRAPATKPQTQGVTVVQQAPSATIPGKESAPQQGTESSPMPRNPSTEATSYSVYQAEPPLIKT